MWEGGGRSGGRDGLFLSCYSTEDCPTTSGSGTFCGQIIEKTVKVPDYSLTNL